MHLLMKMHFFIFMVIKKLHFEMAKNSILNSKAKKLKLLEIMVINSWIARKSWILQKKGPFYTKIVIFKFKKWKIFIKNDHFSLKVYASLSKIFRSVKKRSFSKLKMHNFHEKWQFSLKYPNFLCEIFDYARPFSRKSRQNNNFHLNWNKSEANFYEFSSKMTLLIWKCRFSTDLRWPG